jgi:hypothetical protein
MKLPISYILHDLLPEKIIGHATKGSRQLLVMSNFALDVAIQIGTIEHQTDAYQQLQVTMCQTLI